MFPPALLQFFPGTIVSPTHSCSFPTASGHRQLSLLSKTSILNVFFSIEHMHFFFLFFKNRIRFYESLKDRNYFLPKFAVVAQQELSCKACWEGRQPRMRKGTGRGMRMIPLVELAPDDMSVEHRECPSGPGNSGSTLGWQQYPRIQFNVRALLQKTLGRSLSWPWLSCRKQNTSSKLADVKKKKELLEEKQPKGKDVPERHEDLETVTSKLSRLDSFFLAFFVSTPPPPPLMVTWLPQSLAVCLSTKFPEFQFIHRKEDLIESAQVSCFIPSPITQSLATNSAGTFKKGVYLQGRNNWRSCQVGDATLNPRRPTGSEQDIACCQQCKHGIQCIQGEEAGESLIGVWASGN